MRRTWLISLLGTLAAAPLMRADNLNVSPADAQFFETKVRPILVDRCYKCHSHDSDRVRGGLMLDSREALLHGGDTGPAFVAGKPDDSLLVSAIRYKDEDLQMPPKGDKLDDRQIADLTEWVRRGAPWPASVIAKGSSASKYGGVGRDHWSFQAVKKPAVPTVTNASWCISPVDNFVLEKLEENGLTPSAPADKRTLIRRATFDLIGLPPTEAEIQAFLADNSPDAFAHVVDRLLASPHYGERWGRMWLDVARYSDTAGEPIKRRDPRFPWGWTYRDYVFNAFNTDKPYNQFIIEQLAADRLITDEQKKQKAKTGDGEVQDQSSLAALGFLTLGNQFEGREADIVNDRIDVTTKAFLGLTVACARCHDHKFDPIPTKDYYSLYGVFANCAAPQEIRQQPTLQTRLPNTPELRDYMAKLDDLVKKENEAEKAFDEFRRSRTRDADKRKILLRDEQRSWRDLTELEATHPGAPARANVIVDAARSHDYPVLLRGEVQNKGEVVPRRFLEILSPDPKHRTEWHSGSGRLELAKAIADPKNPLTARVLVNRVWQGHFGQGFVATPDDLGNMSSPPTHPELLDYLASRFVESGWSIKALHRMILLSATYQQSCANNPKAVELDPDNHLIWRANLRRLDFEQMHDSLLAIAGTLEDDFGGKSVRLGTDDFATRRAVYTYVDRRNPPELLTQWDFPNPDVPSGRRYVTLVPQQALFLMNSPLVIETARKLSHGPTFDGLKTDDERVRSLYLAIFQRPPTPEEVKFGVRYVKTNPQGTALDLPMPVAASGPAPARNPQEMRQQRKEERIAAKAETNGGKGKGADNRPAGGVAMNAPKAPMDAWTKLAHALFQTNEAMFLD